MSNGELCAECHASLPTAQGEGARACSPAQVDLAAGPRPTTTRWLVRSPVMLRLSPRSSRGSSCENAARLPAAREAQQESPVAPSLHLDGTMHAGGCDCLAAGVALHLRAQSSCSQMRAGWLQHTCRRQGKLTTQADALSAYNQSILCCKAHLL